VYYFNRELIIDKFLFDNIFTKRFPLVASFILFIALCVSVTYWPLQFMKSPQRSMASVTQDIRSDLLMEPAVRLFGGRTSNASLVSNFQLKSVVVVGNSDESVAILVIDGKPPQLSRVKSEVMPGVIVKEVHSQYVLLSEGSVINRIILPDGIKSDTLKFETVP
jgi:general secretion pathway protein C